MERIGTVYFLTISSLCALLHDATTLLLCTFPSVDAKLVFTLESQAITLCGLNLNPSHNENQSLYPWGSLATARAQHGVAVNAGVVIVFMKR